MFEIVGDRKHEFSHSAAFFMEKMNVDHIQNDNVTDF